MPRKLRRTANNLESVNLSVELDGNIAANINVNKLDVDDRTFTIPASVSAKATW